MPFYRNFKIFLSSMLCLSLLVSSFAFAAKPKPLFRAKTSIKATLNAPISDVYKDKFVDEPKYIESGKFIFEDSDGTQHQAKVKIKARGNYRRKTCDLTPIKLNFKKSQNDGTAFERQDKLKLVAPCMAGDEFQEYIKLEYLSYQIWELLSPVYHFKTRWLDLEYVDSKQQIEPFSRKVFLIESADDVAERLDLERLKVREIASKHMNQEFIALVELFQFFLGNTDFSTQTAQGKNRCCHNHKLFSHEGLLDNALSIPYDFDVTGIVNPPYAKTNPDYPIKSFRDRYFVGWCKDTEHYQTAIQRFLEKQPEIVTLIENADYISTQSKQQTLDFVDEFYQIINNAEQVEQQIYNRCQISKVKG